MPSIKASRNKFLAALAAIPLLAAAGCGGGVASEGASEGGESRTLILGLVEPLVSPSGELAEAFASEIDEASEGRFQIDVVPSSQLGSPLEQLEALRSGSQDLLVFDKGFNSQYVPDYAALDVPFAFESYQDLLDVLGGRTGERLRGELTEAGLETLSDRYLVAPRVVFTNSDVSGPADLSGMNFRVPEIDVYFETWSAIGIQPTPIAWGEIYISLQQGVIDGGEGPLVAVQANSFTEVAQYVLETNHLFSVNNLLMSGPTFEALATEDQQMFKEAAERLVEGNNDRLEEEIAKSKEIIEEEHGATISPMGENEAAEFRSRVDGAVAGLEADGAWSEGFYEEITSSED